MVPHQDEILFLILNELQINLVIERKNKLQLLGFRYTS